LAAFVVGIGGTTRPGSSTETLLRHALAAVEAQGDVETELFAGSELVFPLYTAGEPANPAASRLVEAVRRADGLVIASPGYHGTISGLVKNALDQLEDLRDDERPYLDGRVVGCLSSAYGWQASVQTMSALRSIVHSLRGWPTPLGVAVNAIEQRYDEGGVSDDPKVDEQVRLMAGQVVEFLERWRS
jgi:FMN reductase